MCAHSEEGNGSATKPLLCANLVVNVTMQRERRMSGEREGGSKGGCFIWSHCQTGLLIYAHTDGGVNCHARETYQSLGDDKERVNE